MVSFSNADKGLAFRDSNRQVPVDLGVNMTYLPISVDFSSTTWNTVATHELFNVSGAVQVRIIPECTALLTGASGTLSLGIAGATTAFVAATTGTGIDDDEFWLSSTPAAQYPGTAIVNVVVANTDIGYEITGQALTAGTIVFHLWWDAISEGAYVQQSTGGTL